MVAGATKPAARRTRFRPFGSPPWFVVLLVVFGFAAAGHGEAKTGFVHVLETLQGLGAWGVAGFVVLYVLACVFLAPGSVLTLGAGAWFGLAFGTLWVSLGSTLGATAAFLVGRHLARDWVARRLEVHPRFAALDRAVAEGGWRVVALLRLSPVIPFNLLNYALGLTRVRLREYVVASWLAMLPGTILYVYLGSLAGELAALGADRPRIRAPVEWVFLGLGLLATVAVTVFLGRRARRALALPVRAEMGGRDDSASASDFRSTTPTPESGGGASVQRGEGSTRAPRVRG